MEVFTLYFVLAMDARKAANFNAEQVEAILPKKMQTFQTLDECETAFQNLQGTMSVATTKKFLITHQCIRSTAVPQQ